LILIRNKKKGLLLLIIAMLGFTIYISYLRFKGLYEVCGCGGILNGLSYQTHFFINILLIFSSVYSFIIFNLRENEK